MKLDALLLPYGIHSCEKVETPFGPRYELFAPGSLLPRDIEGFRFRQCDGGMWLRCEVRETSPIHFCPLLEIRAAEDHGETVIIRLAKLLGVRPGRDRFGSGQFARVNGKPFWRYSQFRR